MLLTFDVARLEEGGAGMVQNFISPIALVCVLSIVETTRNEDHAADHCIGIGIVLRYEWAHVQTTGPFFGQVGIESARIKRYELGV